MKFKSVSMTNFLAVKEADIDLLDRGLVAIQGENECDASADSNGAGKSSLVDALCWALYGVTARGVKGDGVIRHGSKHGTLVNVVFVDDGVEYTVRRSRKHPALGTALNITVLASDGSMSSMSAGTEKLTQEVLEKILGCSYSVFKAAVYAGQEQMPDLPSMSDKPLKVLIEEAAGIGVFDEALKVARERNQYHQKAFNDFEYAIGAINKNIESIKGRIDDLKIRFSDFEVERDTKVSFYKNQFKVLFDENVARTADLKALATAEDDLAAIKARFSGIDDERKEEGRLKKIAHDFSWQMANIVDAIEAKSIQIAKAKRALKDTSAIIGTPCSECGKPHTAKDLDEAIAHRKGVLKTYEDELVELQSKHSEKESEFDLAVKAFRDWESKMTDATALTADLEHASRMVEKFKAIQRDASAGRAAIERVNKDLERVQSEINPYNSLLRKEYSALEAAEKNYKEIKEHLSRAKRAWDISDLVVKVLGPAGVRAHILDTVTPFLNERTAVYLGVLSDGNMTATWTTLTKTVKGDLREQFNITVENKVGGQNFESLSGGEKRKARIATALALQDLVARRASKPIDLFIGDEIDQALDESGLERLMMVLEEKAKDRGTVLVISHNSLRDWISEVITVKKTTDGSLIS